MDRFTEPVPVEAIIANAERRHPMHLYVALLLTLSGLPVLFGDVRPGSLSQELPNVFVHIWAGTLVVCGLLIVVAGVVRNLFTALYLELVASVPLALVLFAYANGAMNVGGTRAIVPVSLLLGLVFAYVARSWRAWRTLKRLRGVLKRGRE
jgi:hypothetical protein